jgi:uncharacterized protein YjbI with pentapeptide repeats
MEGSYFARTTLVRADFSNTIFRGRLWSEPDFREANASSANFRKCVFKGASMDQINLENADFTDTYMELVEMRTSYLINTNFSRCFFNGFNINDATLENTNFTEAIFIDFLQATDARFIHVNFTGARGKIDNLILKNTIYEKTGLPIGPYHVVTDEEIRDALKPK